MRMSSGCLTRWKCRTSTEMPSNIEISALSVNSALDSPKLEVMNFLNEIANQYPEAISFAPGRPHESHFEVSNSLEYIAVYARSQLNGESPACSDAYAALGQYGRTNGMIGTLIANMLRNDEGIAVESDDIVVTVGCQEAMCICLLTLCGNLGDVVLVPDPAYVGISGAARVLGIEVVPVSCTDDGIDMSAMEHTVSELRRAGKCARLLYLSPDFANPTGTTISQSQRESLIAFTRSLGIVIVEDHAYNYFQYDGTRIPAMKCAADSDHVIYLGSFSKSVYPGLRLGFIATTIHISTANGTTKPLALEFSKVKSMLTVNTSPLCQAIVGGLLLSNGCSLKQYVAPKVQKLQESRDAMLAALAQYFPLSEQWCAGISWNKPAGGFFLCLKLPFMVTSEDLARSAKEYGVLWTPMAYFFLHQSTSNEIRLAFSYVTTEQIQRGIGALARMVKQRLFELSFSDQELAATHNG